MADKDNERKKLLEIFKELRVADVRDGMDYLGLHNYGSMSPDIRPLERTSACGIAKTARYLPFEGEIPDLSPEEYSEWSGWYYNEVCTYPWIEEIQEGDFIVIDQSNVDAGLMDSNNALEGVRQGANGYNGYVTN